MIQPRKPNNPITQEIFHRRESIAAKPTPLPLAEIFRPMPRGRHIFATKTLDGTRITYRDYCGEWENPDYFSAGLIHPERETFEICRGGISVMTGHSVGSGSDRSMYYLRWAEMVTGSNWALISDCQAFWRAMAFETGFKFRQATGTASSEQSDHSITIDNFALTLLG